MHDNTHMGPYNTHTEYHDGYSALERVPAEASKSPKIAFSDPTHVYRSRELHHRTRADAGIAWDLSLRLPHGPQPKWQPERCGLWCGLITSSGTEIETRTRKRNAEAVGLPKLRTWRSKSTTRPLRRMLWAILAPEATQAVRGQGLQTGILRAHRSTRGLRPSRQGAHLCASRRHCRSRQSQRRGG